jgi:hypothetical protein
MFVRNRVSSTEDSELFVSAKTRTAVPTRSPVIRDALAQASLDPLVRTIAYVPSASVDSQPVRLDAIVLVRDDGHFHLDIPSARVVRTASECALADAAIANLGLRPLVLTDADILREPRFANSRAVWEYVRYAIPIGIRMQVLGILSDDGPMRLGLLLSAIRCQGDPAPAVMALACGNLIEIDLVSDALGPGTMVRARV